MRKDAEDKRALRKERRKASRLVRQKQKPKHNSSAEDYFPPGVKRKKPVYHNTDSDVPGNPEYVRNLRRRNAASSSDDGFSPGLADYDGGDVDNAGEGHSRWFNERETFIAHQRGSEEASATTSSTPTSAGPASSATPSAPAAGAAAAPLKRPVRVPDPAIDSLMEELDTDKITFPHQEPSEDGNSSNDSSIQSSNDGYKEDLRTDDDLDKLSTMLSTFSLSLSREKTQNLYDWIRENAPYMVELEEQANLPKTARALTEGVRKKVPKVKTYWKRQRKQKNGKITMESGSGKKIPSEGLNNGEIVQVCGSVKLEDIIKFHVREKAPFHHRSTPLLATFSSDGVEPAHGGSDQMDVISVCFEGCGTPYPMTVWKYRPGHKPELEDFYGPLVDQIISARRKNLIRVACIACDSKERKWVRGFNASNHTWGCDWCDQKGSWAANRTVLSASEVGSIRDVDYIRSCMNSPHLLRQKEQAQGVARKSPVIRLHYEVPEFDFLWSLPIDSMHNQHGGVTKYIYFELFGPECKAISESSSTKEVEAARVDKLTSSTKLPSMFTRRTRHKVEKFQYKTKEWQTMDLVFMPVIATNIVEDGSDRKVAAFLALYGFLCRVLYQDDEEFSELEAELDLDGLFKTFLQAHSDVMKPISLTYNQHVFGRHALQMRRTSGAPWKTSTARFEASYANVAASYAKGTRNVPKQILQNSFVREVGKHFCYDHHSTVVKRRSDATTKTDDSLIKARGQLYVIEDIHDNALTCRKLLAVPFKTDDLLLDLPWHKVGVWTKTGESRFLTEVNKSEVQCHLVAVANALVEVHKKWLIK